MNSNNIEITQLLGTDSLSSSRIVINDNFKILVNALNNYQNFFNENGVYSSNIISKSTDGTIDFKPDDSTPSMMTINMNRVDINKPLYANGLSTFDETVIRKITPPTNTNKLTISGDVEIQGNLSVSGTVPGGGGSGTSETILSQDFASFIRTAEEGYEKVYNKGCVIYSNEVGGHFNIKYISFLQRFMTPKTIKQYVHKPLVFCGRGIYIDLTDGGMRILEKCTTNGHAAGERLTPVAYNPEQHHGRPVTIRVYPVLIGDNILFDIQFTSIPI